MSRVPFGCKIAESFYRLVPKSSIGSVGTQDPRKGVLLRFQFEENLVGYADCFPWAELGDPPLGIQLELLKKGELTELTSRSLELARVDAEARAEGRSLWENLTLPPSHALLTDVKSLSTTGLVSLAAQGFTRVKIKLGLRRFEEARLLASFLNIFKMFDLKVRLDFNCSCSPAEVDGFLMELGPAREVIDFIEDPCPYDPEVWTAIQDRWKVRLALDRFPANKNIQLVPGSFSVLILKPAIQSPEKVIQLAGQTGTSLVVTSYLDHPLGQLGAAWVAGHLGRRYPDKLETCGLMSHTAYEDHSFSNDLKSSGPLLIPPPGKGFGMDLLLNELEWRPV